MYPDTNINQANWSKKTQADKLEEEKLLAKAYLPYVKWTTDKIG